MESSNKASPTESAGLLSAVQAGAYLGVPGATLQGWRYRGVGPTYVKIGGQIRYRKTDIDAYIAQNERKAVSA